VDTYFGSEKELGQYLNAADPGNSQDPPLAGRGTMKVPCFDPREYWLRKVDRRLLQVATEYTALVGTFDQRMEVYVCPTILIFALYDC
jgi:hypothetical protein